MFNLSFINLVVVDEFVAMYAVRGKLLGRIPVHHALRSALKSSAAAEPFLNGSSSTYVEEMYESWRQDPSSVHKVQFFLFVTHLKFSHKFILIISVSYYFYVYCVLLAAQCPSPNTYQVKPLQIFCISSWYMYQIVLGNKNSP